MTAVILLLSLCAVPARSAPAALKTPQARSERAPVRTAEKQFLRGTLLQRRGDDAAAMASYERALAADPDSPYLCRAVAELALSMGDTERALVLARRLLGMGGKDAKDQVLLGRVLWARDDIAGAQAAFEAALKLDPDSSDAVLSLGTLLAEHAPDKARDLLTRFLGKSPEEAAEAHYQLARIEFEAGRLDASIKHLQDGLETEPESLPLRYALAQAYETQASTDAALSEYLEILKSEPNNVPLLDHIGDILFEKGEIGEARARFTEARRIQPSDPFSSRWLATDAERQGDWGRAADMLKDSSALEEDPALALRLGYYMTQAGRLPEAVRVLEAANARWPSNDQIAYFLALGYDDLKQGEKAVKLLRQILTLKPGFRDARYQLGSLLEKSGRMAESEAEFRRLLADNPDDASALNYLGYSLADRGLRLPEAEGLIREAVRLTPRNPAYLDSLGWVLYKQKRSSEAVAALEAAVELAGDDYTLWEHMGDAYAATGSTAAAWTAWKRSLAFGNASASVAEKAGQAQRGFDAADMGDLYMSHLAGVHGRVRRLSAICRVEGDILGRRFVYDGMLTFRGPKELSLDILGPLFMPMFRVRLGAEGLAMDAFRVEGLDPDAVRAAVEGMFLALREYLAGDVFELRPAAYIRGWWRRRLEAGGRRLELDRDGLRLSSWAPPEGKGRVTLADFIKTNGRLLPRKITLSGPGYSLSLLLDQVKVEFAGAGQAARAAQ